MKRWQIIILSAVLLIGLAIRSVYIQVRKEKDKKREFIQQLHYDLSAKIDSVSLQDNGRRMLYFHCIRNQPDRAVEREINQKIERDERQTFLHFTKSGLIKLRIRSDAISLAGDSLYINTDKDLIIEFRNRTEVLRCSAMESLMRKR